MLGNKRGNKRTMYVPDYVVFDLETTGTSCKTDRIIEISAIKVVKGKVEDEFSSLVNPECPIPYYASQINGITDQMVENEQTLEEVLPEFLDFIGDSVLVGHNIHSFDMKFIYRECSDIYEQVPGNDYIDTLALARTCLPELSHHKLTDLADYFNISKKGAHRALNDCRMNQAVYEKLGKLYANVKSRSQSCPLCGNILVLRNGKFGKFYGCNGYPNCRYTKNA